MALVEFRRAEELAPSYTVLYNIGQVCFQLQDYPGALTALERYLERGRRQDPGVARQADVQRDVEKLRARVATIEIVSTVPDAEVTIDDVAVGKSPLPKPIMVSAGRHKVTVARAGLVTATKVVEIASGDALKLSVDPTEPAAAPPPAPVEPPRPAETTALPPVVEPPPPPPPSRSVPVAGIVVTGGLALGAVATGILALNASSTLKADRGSASATHDLLTSDATKTTALGVATDVLTGGAIIAFGVTLYVGLSGKRCRHPRPRWARGPPGAAPQPATAGPTSASAVTPCGSPAPSDPAGAAPIPGGARRSPARAGAPSGRGARGWLCSAGARPSP